MLNEFEDTDLVTVEKEQRMNEFENLNRNAGVIELAVL